MNSSSKPSSQSSPDTGGKPDTAHKSSPKPSEPSKPSKPSKRQEGDASSQHAGSDADTLGGPAMQGEGNYTAARRHRQSAEDFVDGGGVEQAARDAAPDTERQSKQLLDAEKAGLAPARH